MNPLPTEESRVGRQIPNDAKDGDRGGDRTKKLRAVKQLDMSSGHPSDVLDRYLHQIEEGRGRFAGQTSSDNKSG